jgi:salicylate hydroxylase
MGGLTCALAMAREGFENIHVYETASNLGFVGAGIQLAPNMSRILDKLGVWKEIEREAVLCKETSIRGGCFRFYCFHRRPPRYRKLL